MKIVCFKYAEALYPERNCFVDRDGDGKSPMSFCFYLIESGDDKILIDVGCEGKERYNAYVFESPISLLTKYGLTPLDINKVAITHAHFDHIDLISNYKHAEIYLQNNELTRAGELLSGFEKVCTFEEGIDLCDGVRMQFYGGHTAGSCIVFAKDFLIVADEAYYKRNFTDRVRIRNCYSPEKAQQFVEKYADSDYRLLFFHDDSIMPSKIGYEVVYNDD